MACLCGVPTLIDPSGKEWCPSCMGAPASDEASVEIAPGSTKIRRQHGRYILVDAAGIEHSIGTYPDLSTKE